MTASPQAILDDPTRFLHAIDVDGDRAFFVRTDPELLRQASFVDGRVPFAKSEPVEAPLSALLRAAPQTAGSDRLLFNCSFCGSTLLARLLDQPGRSLVLKEPRSLTDLAAWKILNIRDGLPADRLGILLSFARAALRRRFAPAEAVTIKVANQGNALLDTLAADPTGIRPIFITISRLDFLRAVFRGGVERMHHAAATAWHMATGLPEGDALLKEAVKAGGDPLRKAANLAVLARFLQVGTFQQAARAGGWSERHVIDYSTIARQPHDAAFKAATALGLSIDEDEMERTVSRVAGRHAKHPHQAFSNEGQDRSDNRLHAEHRQVFEDALAWAETTLGPQREVVPEDRGP